MAKMGTRSTNTSSRSIAQMGIGALVLGFVFLSWCVLVGGLSAVQHRANDRNAFEFEWWIVAFEFFLVLLAAVELTGFRRGHSGLVALKAVNTALIMLYAQNWNNNRRNGAYGAYGIKAVRTTFAGFILLAASNALLILTLGTEPALTSSAPTTAGPGAAGVQSTRTLGGASAPLEGGNGQTVV